MMLAVFVVAQSLDNDGKIVKMFLLALTRLLLMVSIKRTATDNYDDDLRMLRQ